jgi:hypothetical protein
MTFKAPRRPHQLARAGTQLTHTAGARAATFRRAGGVRLAHLRPAGPKAPTAACRSSGRSNGCRTIRSIASEEAMPDSDAGRSHKPGALARPMVMP